MIVIFASSCSKGPVCNGPYIQVGMDCCLDKNSDDVCDKDEAALPSEAPLVPEPQPGLPAEEWAQLSEEPNMDKFNEYFSNIYLGKLPLGVQVGPPNFPIKSSVFSKATDQLCSNMDIKKTIPAGSIAVAVYNVDTKNYDMLKTSFPMELRQGGSSGCESLTLQAGKYERKFYIDDVLVAVLLFEVVA